MSNFLFPVDPPPQNGDTVTNPETGDVWIFEDGFWSLHREEVPEYVLTTGDSMTGDLHLPNVDVKDTVFITDGELTADSAAGGSSGEEFAPVMSPVIDTTHPKPSGVSVSPNGQNVILPYYSFPILFSTDGGETFSEIPTKPSNSTSYWASLATDDKFFLFRGTTFYRSNDNCESWDRVNSTTLGQSVKFAYARSNNPNHIVAVASKTYIGYSTDGGETWQGGSGYRPHGSADPKPLGASDDGTAIYVLSDGGRVARFDGSWSSNINLNGSDGFDKTLLKNILYADGVWWAVDKNSLWKGGPNITSSFTRCAGSNGKTDQNDIGHALVKIGDAIIFSQQGTYWSTIDEGETITRAWSQARGGVGSTGISWNSKYVFGAVNTEGQNVSHPLLRGLLPSADEQGLYWNGDRITTIQQIKDGMEGLLDVIADRDSLQQIELQQYIKREGDSMEGHLTVPDPINLKDAVNVRYLREQTNELDDEIDNKVDRAGDSMDGPLILHRQPQEAMEAAPKQYVDQKVFDALNGADSVLDSAELRNLFVAVEGDSMTGFLTLHANPTDSLHAATKDYVDGKITSTDSSIDSIQSIVDGIDSTLENLITTVDGKVDRAGDSMTGALQLHGDPTQSLHAATKQYVDAAVNNLTFDSNTIDDLIAEVIDSDDLVHVAGDTMTGFLTLHAHPTDDFHAATKAYVTQTIIDAVDSATGAITVDSDMIRSTFVEVAGDSMTGQLVAPSFQAGPDAANDNKSIYYFDPAGDSVHELEAREGAATDFDAWILENLNIANSPSQKIWYDLVYADGQYVLSAGSYMSSSPIWWSTDFVNWTQGTQDGTLPDLEAGFSNNFATAYGNGVWISLGAEWGMTSTDGREWSKLTNTGLGANEYNFTRLANSIRFLNGKFVAAGTGDGWNGIITSSDGASWTLQQISGAATDVAYGNGVYASVGYQNSGHYSSDAITWTQTTGLPIETSLSIAFGNGKFVAVGETGSTRVMYSTDGINWTGVNSPDLDTSKLRNVMFAEGYFFATGYYSVYNDPLFVFKSKDGITWEKIVISGNSSKYAYGISGNSVIHSEGKLRILADNLDEAFVLDHVSSRSGLYYDDELIATEVNLKPLFDKVNDLSQGGGAVSDSDLAALELDDLNDVSVPSPNVGDTLVWNGTTWESQEPSGGAVLAYQDLAPADPENGDLWFNTSTLKLSVYHGNAWVQIGA